VRQVEQDQAGGVVDLVRDPGEQDAERGHLVGLDQLLLAQQGFLGRALARGHLVHQLAVDGMQLGRPLRNPGLEFLFGSFHRLLEFPQVGDVDHHPFQDIGLRQIAAGEAHPKGGPVEAGKTGLEVPHLPFPAGDGDHPEAVRGIEVMPGSQALLNKPPPVTITEHPGQTAVGGQHPSVGGPGAEESDLGVVENGPVGLLAGPQAPPGPRGEKTPGTPLLGDRHRASFALL
jgi:hypothetical protein